MDTARIIEEHKTKYIISHNDNELTATVRGSFFTAGNFPKVGDYILFTKLDDGKAVIEQVLPRKSSVMRKEAGGNFSQVIVTNVDIIFIVIGLDLDFNLSRLERYLLLASQSNIDAVIILNKMDTVEDVNDYINQAKSISGLTPVHAISALNNKNMEPILEYLHSNITAVLLGSSGAGKSTITNCLLNKDIQKTSKVKEQDSRGRHTTTTRQLFKLSTGAYLIDTPGMRELGVIDSSNEDENAIFLEIDELSKKCAFSNCDHEKSRDCAVLEELANGNISERQLKNYLKIKKERTFKNNKNTEPSSAEYKKKQKKLYKKDNDF